MKISSINHLTLKLLLLHPFRSGRNSHTHMILAEQDLTLNSSQISDQLSDSFGMTNTIEFNDNPIPKSNLFLYPF